MASNLNSGEDLALLIQAQVKAHQISQEDARLIAILEAPASTEVQPPDEIDDAPSGPSRLFQLTQVLASATDLAEPDVFAMGLVALGEERWTEKHRRAAWTSVVVQHGSWFKKKGYDIAGLEAVEKPKPKNADPIKEVGLDPIGGGFVLRFRNLPRQEHDRTRNNLGRVTGVKYFDGQRPGSRLAEPHWVVSGDDVSARALFSYLFEFQAAIQQSINKYGNKAYYNSLVETREWEIKPGVVERIQEITHLAERMVPMSQAHEPSPEFRLYHNYESKEASQPWRYQVGGVEYILACTRRSRDSKGQFGTGVMVADDMGLGKTIQTIIAITEAWQQEMLRDPEKKWTDLRALIVCPSRVKIGWQREIENWLPEEWGLTVQLLRSGRIQAITGNFVIASPGVLRNMPFKEGEESQPEPLFAAILAQRWYAMVADEAHRYKNYNAQRTGVVLELFSGKRQNSLGTGYVRWRLPSPMRIMLTGTPVLNRPKEFASQLDALGLLDELGGLYKFESTYCSRYTTNEELQELHQRLRQRGYLRREKQEMAMSPEQKIMAMESVPTYVLNRTFVDRSEWAATLERQGWKLLSGVLGQIPPKIRKPLPVPLSNRDRYRRAEKEFRQWILDETDGNSGNLSNSMRGRAIAKIAVLKRIAEEGKVAAVIKWINNFLVESDTEKLVLFTHHLHVQDQLIRYYGRHCAYIRGDQSINQSKAMEDRFQTDPGCRLIFCTLGAGGEGLTLTAASTVLFLCLGWNPAIHNQGEDRVWARVNDIHGAYIYFVLANNTIDNEIAAIIDRKRAITSSTNQGIDAPDEEMIQTLLDRYASGSDGVLESFFEDEDEEVA